MGASCAAVPTTMKAADVIITNAVTIVNTVCVKSAKTVVSPTACSAVSVGWVRGATSRRSSRVMVMSVRMGEIVRLAPIGDQPVNVPQDIQVINVSCATTPAQQVLVSGIVHQNPKLKPTVFSGPITVLLATARPTTVLQTALLTIPLAAKNTASVRVLISVRMGASVSV